MEMDIIKQQTVTILEEVLELSQLRKGQLFVLGLSSSEVIGGHIGKHSNLEVGQVIVKTILDVLSERGIYLAVQGCEHLNRALVVERDFALAEKLEIVNVLPSLHAGGAGQLAAFEYMADPVEVEFVTAYAGLDIGDTAIGMHVKHVQVPLRPTLRQIGYAHVTALASRPKLIGGSRALYQEDMLRKG
ncbi:TIGR01440 family protein [Streptococcus sp. 19428wC2_LYSM12]|uniref:TIGR01440 family protein n=2 Tax=Streptococcus TaxID=1301 RepID=UPI00107297CF|nr:MULTISPECIES: TIGR01440 family protein [unclassified Streptococcus]MBF0787940.1 TIGR01440 family protein [Streptococcus sp. 19428wC2_LYSM12]MCQ9211305.1 TIGR01440 family protein [Streptococcus sp. B01]MCQ9214617.1 TIGR01440 family protein [Streptococcus sp. O1]TFV05064.1 TIGR01440 family protein [Streptococcus sp. LYSM12]